ncbi:MAG: sialidase family protein [Steroidobacteraceae bacterium]|nr:exo-alpha-sialidase [Nevskiaceae bacterium]MCP5339210.1 exo-alpha-sialidase [Nevskiaceae bacterium]MCP5359449.1 exo-alpha-sialidase [Nevskiaceae bacterium]MCP5470880.1 exo-alpha-sialidase [Nevskiaceae bacterium]
MLARYRQLALATLAFTLPALAATAATEPSAPAATLVSSANHQAQSPEVAIGPDDSVNMIWIDQNTADSSQTHGHGHSHMASTNLFFARSTDGGLTFSAPVSVNPTPGEVWGFSVSKPRIAVGSNGTIHVFYPANDVHPTNGKPVAVARYTRSTDGGRTFEKPQQLNAWPTTDASHLVHGGLSHAHVFGAMAVDNAGSVYTLWIDTRDMAKEGDSGKVFMAVSRDDGRTFGKDAELYPADVCPCCQLTASVDSDQRLWIGSRQVDGKFRDSVVSVSTDGGRTFTPRQRVSGEHRWEIEGCPLKPTSVTASGNNVWATYFNGGEDPAGVYVVRSTDGGKSWMAPQLVHPGATTSDAPAIALAGSTLHLFWHAKVGDGARRIYTRASTDGGVSFGPVVELPAPPGATQLPAVAGRANGSVQIAWQQGTEVRSMRWQAVPAAAQAAAAR